MNDRWSRRNMYLDTEKMADLLIQALPQPLEELLSELQPDLQDEKDLVL